jgi:hypothetical protein
MRSIAPRLGQSPLTIRSAGIDQRSIVGQALVLEGPVNLPKELLNFIIPDYPSYFNLIQTCRKLRNHLTKKELSIFLYKRLNNKEIPKPLHTTFNYGYTSKYFRFSNSNYYQARFYLEYIKEKIKNLRRIDYRYILHVKISILCVYL